ncbi:hypothetical protein ONZ43_g3241 [Nemania bipapillata]|uniref:Uncharacterized protein n=1 Tax=Nemania bipapillata TaxID=110536 RepID=A0ACC2IXP6_9PEZI|nr:hypothetical protein ONZ43_g3241 [Nemania bipapillata]
MASPYQQQNQHPYQNIYPHSYQKPYQMPSQDLCQYPHTQTSNPIPHPQNGGSLTSTGNVAQPNSIQVPGGIHDSGTRVSNQVDMGAKITTFNFDIRNYNSRMRLEPGTIPGLGTSGSMDSPHYQPVSGDGPFRLLHETSSLKPSASRTPDNFTRPLELAAPVGNPAPQSSFSNIADISGSSAEALERFATDWPNEIFKALGIISMNHEIATAILKDYRRFIPKIFDRILNQIEIIETQKKMLVDELRDQDSLPEEVNRVLEKVAKILQYISRRVIKSTKDLKDVIIGKNKSKDAITKHKKRLLRKMKRLKSLGPTDHKLSAEIALNMELNMFSSNLDGILNAIHRFESLVSESLKVARSVSLSGINNVLVILDKFRMSRYTSASLYQQLGQMCPEHQEHRFYFHLQIEEGEDPEPQRVKFHLSVERKNIDEGGPKRIWFCALATLKKEEDDGSDWSSNASSSSILSILEPMQPSPVGGNDTSDSAKQVARSVLGFSPNLWPQERPLKNSDILILERKEGGMPEPLLEVNSTKAKLWETAEALGKARYQRANDQPEHMNPEQLASNQAHPAILLRLAIILLELAYLEEMPYLREIKPGYVDQQDESYKEVKRKCDPDRLNGADAYIRAVRHCFDFNGTIEEFFSNQEHQLRFYPYGST